jgi:phosphate transport system permease protein
MRKHADLLFQIASLMTLVVALTALGALVWDIFTDGASRLSWSFIVNIASRNADQAGVYHALMGSIWVIALTGLLALPIGVAAAIYLEEYGSRSRIARFIELNIANLAAVPSIIYGLLGLGLFVRFMGMGQSSYALGATKWQTIWHQVLPMALPGVLTGLILALSRAIGETAPLITIGALTYIPFAPDSVWSKFTVLPIQIFNWVSRPQADFKANAAAGILVLLALLLTMNAVAIVVRDRFQRQGRA